MVGKERERLIIDDEALRAVTTKSLYEVEGKLSSEIESLPEAGPVLITKDGRPRALLIEVNDDADLESLSLSVNPRFWRLFGEAANSGAWAQFS